MTETYEKKDPNTLTVTQTFPDEVFDENRATIQTLLDHAELAQVEIKKRIDELKAKLAILDK